MRSRPETDPVLAGKTDVPLRPFLHGQDPSGTFRRRTDQLRQIQSSRVEMCVRFRIAGAANSTIGSIMIQATNHEPMGHEVPGGQSCDQGRDAKIPD